ncbi:D-beta-hydroxybutyrate dehydrogenase, mitochondrial-like [Ciona intestinalis]
MFTGDLGRSVFGATVFTFVFALGVPWIGSKLFDLLGLNYGCCTSTIAFFATCFLALLIFAVFPRGRLNPKDKAVLITGCDSGFGPLLAKQLHALGMHVFAGCLLKDKGGEGAKQLMKIKSSRFHVLQLDVTNDSEIKMAVQYIRMNIPPNQNGLWGIVNNAGASAFGEIEWSSIDLYKKVADVNLWGVIRCTQACLPLIRRAKGRVVNMASGFGRMIAGSRSVYGITKWAVEGFSDCLRYEMRRWGVKVSIIEPGNYIAGTSIFTKDGVKKLGDSMWEKMPDNVKEDYGKKLFDLRVAEMQTYCSKGMDDLRPVLNAYEDALLSRIPLIRYQPMEAYWTIRSFVFTHFPSFIADYLYIYRKAKK